MRCSSSELAIDLSPIQKRRKVSFGSAVFSPAFPHPQHPSTLLDQNDTLPPLMAENMRYNAEEYFFPQYSLGGSTSFLSPSNAFYPRESTSHLPLSKVMTDLLMSNFNCIVESDEVHISTFLDKIRDNEGSFSILCGENKCFDLMKALTRICERLQEESQRTHSYDIMWLTWSSLLQHLESEAPKNSRTYALKQNILPIQQQHHQRLEHIRKMRKESRMQMKWGKVSKEKYRDFLIGIDKDGDYLSSRFSSSGGGGSALSKERDTIDIECNQAKAEDNKKPIKTAEKFQLILESLRKLEVDHDKARDRQVKSDSVDLMIKNKTADDLAAKKKIEMLEAETSLEGTSVEIGKLIAMRKQKLSNEEESIVSDALASPHDNTLLIEKFNQDITRRKMSCLLPGTWLNDEVVNYYMNMLQERDKKLCALCGSTRRSSHFFNSFFISKLLEGDTYSYRNVKRWSKKFDIFSKDKVFFPVNISNAHWTMMVAYMQQKKVIYYDSMGGKGAKYTKAIVQYLNDDSIDKRKHPIDTDEWQTSFSGLGAPQQENSFDCGMFSIMYADFLSDDLPLEFDQSEIDEYRRKVVAAILRGSLNYPIIW